MQNEDTIKLAEKIAKLIASESRTSDLVSIKSGLDQIVLRLEKLEKVSDISKAGIQIQRSDHPSQDRFAISEAIVDSLFEKNATEKACTFEPNGRPCDHCSMCSSRGF